MAAADDVIFTEEPSTKRRVIRKEACLGHPNDGKTLSIVIEDNSSSSSSSHCHDELWRLMTNEGDEAGNKQLQIPLIQKVPKMLREKKTSEKCYDPLVVSIGPYHHGKDELKEVEELKIPVARQYVKESKKPFEVLYYEVAEVAGDARKCYPEESTSMFDDKAFNWLMFLDGCFILQFLASLLHNRPIKGMKFHFMAFVRRDLMLLENQLPYHVLKVLMSLRFVEDEEKKLIDNFIYSIRGVWPRQHSCKEKLMKYVPRSFWEFVVTRSFCRSQGQSKLAQRNIEDQPVHLLDIFRTRFIRKTDLIERPLEGKIRDWYSFPAASELKTLGIHFRPSRNDQFTGIKFKMSLTAGILTLPKIIIDDTTKSILLNLVAYEACIDVQDDFGITSYICFMDSIIDRAEDVKELRSKGIIFNILGSDKQAAELFNEVAKDLVPNPYAFVKVKEGIEGHYRSKMKKWISEWLHNHFYSPWTFIAFVAATFALILTFIQTYFSVLGYCLDDTKKHIYFWCYFGNDTSL